MDWRGFLTICGEVLVILIITVSAGSLIVVPIFDNYNRVKEYKRMGWDLPKRRGFVAWLLTNRDNELRGWAALSLLGLIGTIIVVALPYIAIALAVAAGIVIANRSLSR